MEQERILVVDDDEGLLHLSENAAVGNGILSDTLHEGHDAIMAARQEIV